MVVHPYLQVDILFTDKFPRDNRVVNVATHVLNELFYLVPVKVVPPTVGIDSTKIIPLTGTLRTLIVINLDSVPFVLDFLNCFHISYCLCKDKQKNWIMQILVVDFFNVVLKLFHGLFKDSLLIRFRTPSVINGILIKLDTD